MSPKSAGLARKFGYQNVKVFHGGEPAWKKEEYPLESSTKFVGEANIVLIDLRAPAAYKDGHIPRAINIPFADLKNKWSEGSFPDYKGSNLVFYTGREDDLLSALETMRDWGFVNSTIYAGGVDRWVKEGQQLDKKVISTPSKLTFVRKLASHEVSIDDFKKAYADKSVLIIDARSSDEFNGGHFGGACNIPSEEGAKRMNEIPRDKPVLIHCSTGSRAEMLYEILKSNKYENVKLLKANITFENGKGKITD